MWMEPSIAVVGGRRIRARSDDRAVAFARVYRRRFSLGLEFSDLTASAHPCLIADVQMPNMSGLALYGNLVASGTPIPTILITAYPDDAIRRARSTPE